jgi:D-alanine transaminase/branched-chain amino acid aminotransferase
MEIFINNRFADSKDALLHISDLSIQRGYAIFDFFRVVNGVPLFMQDHFDRFFASAAAMHLPVNKSREELSDIIHELIRRNNFAGAGVRITLTGGYSPDGYHPAEPNLFITCSPISTATDADFEKGFSILTYQHQRELPHVKSINYMTAVWLQPMMKEKQVDDILYYNKESITEFPRSNVFIVTADNKLVTPSQNILKGITRKNVLSIARSMMPVEERNISTEELCAAPEVFLTATTRYITPILEINKQPVGNGQPGPFTTLLYRKLVALEKTAAHLVSR